MEQPRRLNLPLLLASMALLISLSIAGSLGYYYWKHARAFTETVQLTGELHGQLQHNQAQLTQLHIESANLYAQLQRQQTTLGQLKQMKDGDARPWLLAEANYLVNLTHYNLIFTRDIPAAITLLQTIDKRITLLDDPTLLPIRQLLAQYTNALQAIPSVDLAGLLTRLHALQEQVTRLPLYRPTPASKESIAAKTPTENLPAWRRALQLSWEALQKLIVIRHTEQPITPSLPQEQQLYLQQNLQLLLQQAQWAALRGQAAVYQLSLQQAKQSVQRYFAGDAAATQAVLRTMSDLQKIDVHPATPNISALIQAIQKAATRTRTQGA